MASWYYCNTNGEKIGPMPFIALKALAAQGLLTPETIVENDQGKFFLAGNVDILRLSFPVATPSNKRNVVPPVTNIVYDYPSSPPIPPSPDPFAAALPPFTPIAVPLGKQVPTWSPPRPHKTDSKFFYLFGGVAALVLVAALTGVVIVKHRQAERRRQAADQAQREQQAADQARRERLEAEAKAEDARKKQEEAENIAAEQAEQSRREAQAKAEAAAEEARRKREEADKEAERKRQQLTIAEKEIVDKLTAVPDIWEDIALPNLNVDKPVVLEGTEFLWKIKDRVTLSIVPFVDLAGFAILQASPSHNIDFSMKSANDVEQIIAFSLKESGVSYEWNTEALQTYGDTDFLRKGNRLFLSKLRIEIDGLDPKEVALWTPLVFTAAEFVNTFKTVGGSVRFALWLPDGNGKELASVPDADAPMLLDFDELSYGRTVYNIEPKAFEFQPESLAYTPIIPRVGEAEISGAIRATQGKESRLYIDFTSDTANELERQKKTIDAELKKVQAELNRVRPNLDSINSRIIRLEQANIKMYSNIGALEKQRSIPHANVPLIDRQIAELRRRIAWNLDPLNPNGLPAEYERKRLAILAENQLDAQRNDINSKLQAKQAELGAEKKRLEQIRAAHFSLYLLRMGTSSSEVYLPENRLLLFRVIP